ncbi:hypothetical protein [Brevibacillus thermoruber]|uniref:hypothetical protein n=1 Tax=Brevibacillus thermoruber TaxID=33942 RepID=UPI000556924F|nr:hypothetical protein [Brevibacillus thermoruber]
MWMTIGLLGLLGVIVFLVMSIISAIRKTGQAKNHLKVAGVCFLLFLVAVAKDTPKKSETTVPTETANQTESNQTVSTTTSPAEQPAATPISTASTQTSVQQQEAPKQDAPQPDSAIPGTIGMNPEQFKAAFNKASKEFNSDLKINTIKVEEGPVQNSFQVNLTKNLSMVGVVNKKDGSVRSVTMIGVGDGSVKSGVDIILGMGILITATNPEISADDRGKVMEELKLIGDDSVDILDLDTKTIRNGIRYTVKSSRELGIWFTAGDANEE